MEALGVADRETEEGGPTSALALAYWALSRKAEADAALADVSRDHALDHAFRIALQGVPA